MSVGVYEKQSILICFSDVLAVVFDFLEYFPTSNVHGMSVEANKICQKGIQKIQNKNIRKKITES